MTPLLQALQAAARAGFDAPRCKFCTDGLQAIASPDDATFLRPAEELPCPACDATGLDASDPERLIARAIAHLHDHARDVVFRYATNEVTVYSDVSPSCLPPGVPLPQDSERHDGTATGRATALLRLAARVMP